MVTLEDAKAHLRVTHELEDELIESLIHAAYAMAETRCGRIFQDIEKTIHLDRLPDGRIPIHLPITPVQEIISFEYIAEDDSTQVIDPEDLILDKRPLYPVLVPKDDVWPHAKLGIQHIEIVLQAGFKETPHDIRAAILLIIGHLYFNREAVTQNTVAELPMGVDFILTAHSIPRLG